MKRIKTVEFKLHRIRLITVICPFRVKMSPGRLEQWNYDFSPPRETKILFQISDSSRNRG